MGRALKWAAAIVVLLVASIAIFLLYFDWNMLRGPIESRVAAATGRTLSIEGDLQGELAWQPWVRARDLRLSNADRARAEDLVSIEELAIRIDARQLLRGQLVITAARILGADIHLHIDRVGRAYWYMCGEDVVP